MSATAATREVITQRRQEDYEAYESWRAAEMRRDEITDQAERLAAPMENTFTYTLAPEGLVTDGGMPILPVIAEGLQSARLQACVDNKWQFEAHRREIELEEQQLIEDFARQYDVGVHITSLSLDRSDYEGMRAIAEGLGHELPAERPHSEDILARRMWLGMPPGLVVLSPIPDAVRINGVDIGAYDRGRQKMIARVVTLASGTEAEHQNVVKNIRERYDSALQRQFGGDWYAGRPGISGKSALDFIVQQSDLLDTHMSIVHEVYNATSDKQERLRRLQPHRYNLAAALDDRLNGKQVVSVGDSGNAARAEGRTFDGDCPTAENQETAAAQMDKLGYRTLRKTEVWSRGQCRNCVRETHVWKSEDGGCNVCKKCADAHTASGDTGLANERRKADDERRRSAKAIRLGKETMSIVRAAESAKRTDLTTRQRTYKERMVFGGTVKEYVDPVTGQTTQISSDTGR